MRKLSQRKFAAALTLLAALTGAGCDYTTGKLPWRGETEIVVKFFVPADGEGSVLIYTQGPPHFFLLAGLSIDP